MTEWEHVLGIDLSLTAPGMARISRPWGDEQPHAVAATIDRVPNEQTMRGLVLHEAAERIARRAVTMTIGDRDATLVVMEAVLLQSTVGKATERAAFWWMVRAQLELAGFAVVDVHPTSRRSIAMDSAARALWRSAEKNQRTKIGKLAVLQATRRRWSSVVLADDNAADALVCAEIGAHAVGFGNLPELEKAQADSLHRALERIGLSERKAQ